MPLPTTGLTFNVDAADTDRLWKEEGMTTHPVDGEEVAAWDDEGGATAYAFHESIGKPIYRSSGINGLGALDFDGVNDVLRSAQDDNLAFVPVSTFVTASAWTFYVAFQLDGAGSDLATISDNSAIFADIQAYFGLAVKTTAGLHTLVGWNYGGVTEDITAPPITLALNTPYVACIKLASGTLSLDLNDGAQTASVTSGDTDSVAAALGIGGNTYSSQFFNGRIGQCVIYNIGVTGSDDADAKAFLMAKWTGEVAAADISWLSVTDVAQGPRLVVAPCGPVPPDQPA